MSETMKMNDDAIREDRIIALRKRIMQLRQEAIDPQFVQYLDQVLFNLQSTEDTLTKTERHLEQSYQLYLRRNGLKLGETQPKQESEAAPAATMPETAQPSQVFVQQINNPQSQMGNQRVNNVQQQMHNQQVNNVQQQMHNQQVHNPQQQVHNQQAYNPQKKANDHKSLEFKIGTFVMGVVGILFLLIAFVSFGLQYMDSTAQSVFFYVIGIALFAFSELFLSKRLEKFSYFVSGLGISGLYVTTLLSYLYLKIFPSLVTLFITITITAFFFWLSYKKDSGMMRIICLLGCYVSLIPIDGLDSLPQFAIPAIIILALNVAGVLCPIKHANAVIDYIQYTCTVSLMFFMTYLMYVSGLAMWPVYILICANMLTLHLVCLKKTDQTAYQVLYIIMNAMLACILLYVGNHENWMILGALGVAVMCAFFMFLYRKTNMRYAPYILAICYALLAFSIDENRFNLFLACLIIFIVNRVLAVVYEGFAMPDAIYTMLSALIVCFSGREDGVQVLGYAFAAAIIIGAFFVKKYEKYHLYTAVSFAWIFLLTENMYPLVCSVLICVLAAVMIAGGFMKKDKPVRIYGLCLIIFVALKLVGYDFKEAESAIRIVVFLISGLVILGVSFLYIFLEKKLEDAAQVPGQQ